MVLERSSQAYTIEGVLELSLTDKVNWILTQSNEIKHGFLKWKTLDEIQGLSEEELTEILTKLMNYMPSRMIYNIMSKAGYSYN